MKNIITLIAVFWLSVLSSQIIKPLANGMEYGYIQGAYYKDINNDFEAFTGIWRYENNGAILEIKLQKMLNVFDPDFCMCYTDYMVGGYKYTVSGVEKINTISLLATPFDDPYEYSLAGHNINTADCYPICEDCLPLEKRVLLIFNDPLRTQVDGLDGQLVLRRIISGGSPKLEAWLIKEGNISYEEGTTPPYTSFTVPWGKYVLTKVE